MSIDPLMRGPLTPDEVARHSGAAEVRHQVTQKVQRDAAAPTQDRVEVSAEAMQLAARAVGDAEHSLPVAKVHEILSKLASGFYESDEVLSVVAEKVADEFHGAEA